MLFFCFREQQFFVCVRLEAKNGGPSRVGGRIGGGTSGKAVQG